MAAILFYCASVILDIWQNAMPTMQCFSVVAFKGTRKHSHNVGKILPREGNIVESILHLEDKYTYQIMLNDSTRQVHL